MAQRLEDRFARCVVSHCAPVLARLKSANLICFPTYEGENLTFLLESYQRLLSPKGIYIRVLRQNRSNALIYLYREKMLSAQVQQEPVAAFLKQFGYAGMGIEQMLLHLQERIAQQDGFPHEIGIFLGYPLHDVVGFMQHRGQNYCHSGTWKVYDRVDETKKLFTKFQKCTAVYCKLFQSGRSIPNLTVAA